MTFRTVAIGMLPGAALLVATTPRIDAQHVINAVLDTLTHRVARGAAMAVSLRWVKAGRARRSRAAR